MPERRRGDRRDPETAEALAPEVMELLRVVGAPVRALDDPRGAARPADRRQRAPDAAPPPDEAPGSR